LLCKERILRRGNLAAGLDVQYKTEDIRMDVRCTQKSDSRCAGGPQVAGHYVEFAVAPRTNARIRFSSTSLKPDLHLSPQEVLENVDVLSRQGATLLRVGISGPGDPLACIEPTLETLSLLHARFPKLELSIKSLGINGEYYASRLARAGVTHVDLQVNAVTEDILEKIYAWIRPGFKTLRLQEAAKILIAEQKKAVRAFKDAGMSVSIITVIYPENNIDHVETIAHLMADLGADDMHLIPYRPEEGAEINLTPPDAGIMEALCKNASRYIKVHLEKEPASTPGNHQDSRPGWPKPTQERPNVAVVSSDGMDVDLHLGEAIRILIYGPREDGLACLLESRPAPEPGGGESRWEALADTLADCFVLLAASAGENPRKILKRRGIKVLITDDSIEGTVDVLYGGGRKKKKSRR
jgi:nitrogen fixation protein NifB